MARIYARILTVLIGCIMLSGCSTTYMKNRGNDLSDVLEIGLTVNGGAPQFRLEFQPFIFPIGYSNLDGKLIGFGNRNWGVNDFECKGWGALLTGEGKYGVGPFNPCDPRQYAPIDDPENAPEERPAYALGVMPLMQDDKDVLWTKNAECNKGIHLGWIGIHIPCRPLDLVDFLLGFTTLDIMHDDAAAVTTVATAPDAPDAPAENK